jgi:hypothetical protein
VPVLAGIYGITNMDDATGVSSLNINKQIMSGGQAQIMSSPLEGARVVLNLADAIAGTLKRSSGHKRQKTCCNVHVLASPHSTSIKWQCSRKLLLLAEHTVCVFPVLGIEHKSGELGRPLFA